MNNTARAFSGELLGTFLMCFFGIGAVATAVLAGAHTGPFQVGMVWGITIAIAIYATRNLSCAHFNPAVSIAMCVSKRLPWKELPIYLVGQCLGAFLAAFILWLYFGPTVAALQAGATVPSGADFAAAISVWAEPYPNNGSLTIGVLQGALGEGIFLCILLIIIFSMTEDANVGKPGYRQTRLCSEKFLSPACTAIQPPSQHITNILSLGCPRMKGEGYGHLATWGSHRRPAEPMAR